MTAVNSCDESIWLSETYRARVWRRLNLGKHIRRFI